MFLFGSYLLEHIKVTLSCPVTQFQNLCDEAQGDWCNYLSFLAHDSVVAAEYLPKDGSSLFKSLYIVQQVSDVIPMRSYKLNNLQLTSFIGKKIMKCLTSLNLSFQINKSVLTHLFAF